MGQSPQFGSMGDMSIVSFNLTSYTSTDSMKKVINWQLITDNKRRQIACDNAWENTERIPHQYKIGDEVLRAKRSIQIKYSKNKSDPYKITAVHTNSTVTIAQGAQH